MRTRIIALILIIASVAFVIGSIFVSHNNRTKTTEVSESQSIPGFTEISSVQGISFFVNSSFVDRATAITQISDSVSFQKNQYYSYKNGVDKYLLFNMENLIVVAEKGTDFYIGESADKPYALQNTNMMNIWFTQGSKKFDSVTDGDTTTTVATAGVSINTKTYGDFCGKLVNTVKDGEEWSLFVGVPGERYDKLSTTSQDGIETIIKTLSFSNTANLLSQNIYAVSLDGSDEKQLVDTEVLVIEEEDSLGLTNQSSAVDKNEETAYTSTPYNMLSLGDNGILSAFNDNTLTYEEPIICPLEIFRGDEADELIKQYCLSSGDHDFFEAPDGSSWEVLKYKLNFKNCIGKNNYVNIKFKGLDAELLKYRGIKYAARTYDMNGEIIENGDWNEYYYCFYPVPNGCYEYCLEIGERESLIDDEETSAAYYHIVNENPNYEKNVEILDAGKEDSEIVSDAENIVTDTTMVKSEDVVSEDNAEESKEDVE